MKNKYVIVLFLPISIIIFSSFSKIKKNENPKKHSAYVIPPIPIVYQQGTCPTSPMTYDLKDCQCVVYVKRRLGYNDSQVDAYSWGPKLVCEGFVTSAIPQNKDIAVLQRGYQNADATSGHVGLVTTATLNSGGTSYTVQLVHSNWGSGTSECNCNNVSYKTFIVPVSDIGNSITFYRKSGAIKSCN